MKTVEAAEAAANFAAIVNNVHSRRESVEILNNGVPFAQLVPAAEAGCDSHEFARDLAGAPLTAKERRAFATAISKGRKSLKPLRNPWD